MRTFLLFFGLMFVNYGLNATRERQRSMRSLRLARGRTTFAISCEEGGSTLREVEAGGRPRSFARDFRFSKNVVFKRVIDGRSR